METLGRNATTRKNAHRESRNPHTKIQGHKIENTSDWQKRIIGKHQQA